MKTVNATSFKAHCLAILDEVARNGETVTVTKRGRPVARVVTVAGTDDKRSPQETLAGTVEILGDIISPVLAPEAWDVHGTPR